MQRAIDDMMNQMGPVQLYFVITAVLAIKLSSLMWKAHPEDLSLGIHPFCIGETSPDTIAQLHKPTMVPAPVLELDRAPVGQHERHRRP
jgi:hypothetical protein